MCTYLKEVELKTATHDIKVYKLVKWEDGKLFAPYRNVEYPSTTLHTKLGKVVTNPYGSKDRVVPRSCHSINIGLHSFKSKGEAIKWMNNNFMLSPEHQIIKATIPKGAMYYEGFWDYDGKKLKIKTIVSDKLILHPEKVVMDRTIKHFEVKTRLWTFDSSNI